ncbi:hypothetical protein F4775DRAFT_444836 [Biscogniauxia sp. FL1348]|nr:hypothetical protein F4775DRAFT_444836 [Biscogniauxia sp. FL1348]
MDKPKALGKTTPIAETEETKKEVTLEDSKSHEDSTSNELAETPTEPEKGTVAAFPSEQLTIGNSKAEGLDETIEVEDTITREEQEDVIESQEPVEETARLEEASSTGEQAPSADTKDGAPFQVADTATPEAKDTKVESPGSNDAVIEPEQPKESAFVEATKPGEESSSQRTENSSVALEVVTTTDPGVINESEVPKEVSEPAAVTETIPSQSSEQDKKESSAASNVQGQPQIVKDDAVSTDYDPASPDPKTGTEEKAESPQSETVKENPDSAEPIVEVKEEASSAPSQVVTASDGGVETLGETAPVAIFEVRTDCPPLKPTGDPAPGLSTKELIERKIQTHQMQEDDECKDTVGPTPREEIAARRASKGEEQSVPGCVRDSPGVIENDFGEIAPELVIGNVLSEEEGLEEERGSNEGEPGDKPTAGVQETALLQPDDSQGPGIPKVQENKSTGPKINPEDSQHPLEDVSQEAVEGRPAEDTVRQAHQLISPGEDQIEPAHHLVEDTPEISENDKGQVMGNSQEFANKLHSQPREIMITDISEGVTLGESSTGPQCEDGISETAESPIDTAQTLEANEPVQDMEPVANNETQEPLETKSLMETTEVPNSPSDEDVHTSRDKDVLEIPVQDEEVDDNGSRGNAAPHKDTELIMQDIEPELDSGNSKEAAGRGIAAGGGSTQTSMGPEENPPTESKASGDYAASSSKHRQEDPVASEEGQPGPTPTKTLIEDSSSGPEVDQEFSETQPSTQSHSSGPGLGFESLADVAQAKTEPKTTSTSTTEVKSATGQNEDVSQQLPLSLNNASQKDPPQREMNRDSYTKDELKHETSDNAIAKDSIPEIVAEPEQIASVALHSSEQYVEDTSHLVTITENTDPKSETPDTTESTSIQEEYEASMPQPVEDENEEQILGRAKKPANDEPVLPSDIQDPERTITSSLDGVDSQVLSSISSQKSTNNEVSSAVEEPIVENPERVEGQSSEDRDEHIQKSTLPPPTDHVQELTIQKLESIKSSSDQSRVEMPAQEHVGVCLAKSPIVKASTPEETIVQVPDEATKALLVESHETIPPSVEKPEESRPTQLEEHAPRQPPSDNKLISAQKSTSVEESNVVEETRLIKDDESDSYKLDTETVGKVEGKSSIEPPTVANDTEASDQLHVPNSSESGIIASSSTDADDDFVLVERSDKDVPKEPILETQEPESVTLGQSAPIKEKQEAPLHYPVKEAIPETEDSDGTHTNKEGQTESEVNELVASSVTDKMDSAGHGTCEDLSNLSPESVVMLESSVEHGSEAPESPVIIDKAHPATENDSDESSMSMSGSHVIIEREIDQSDDHGGIPVKGVQGHKEPKQTRNSDSEQIQPLVESPQREKLNSGVSSEQLQAQGEVPFKPVDTRQADASDKDPDNDSESTDEARVDVIGSEVAGTAMIAAGSAMLALKPSAISESARSSTTIQKVVSEDDVERGDGSSLGRVPSERTVEYLPVAKSEHASAETHKAAEMSKEVPDSSPQESPKNTEAIHTPPQVNSSDDSQPTEKNLSPVDDVVTESIAEKTNQKSLSVTSESPELVSSNTPLSESFRVIDARPMNTKRSRHDFFPALVHSGTQTDEDLDFASLWDRNLQCFFDLANMEPRSSTPGVVIPDLSDSQAKAFGRARSVKKQRRQSYKRAEATVAAAVIIYAASQQLGPRQKEMLGSHQAKDDDGKEMKTSQEPTQEPHDISSGVAKARSVGRKEVSIADLSTDESSRSHHSDRHHRHRHHRHHHSEQSRDNNNSDEHHHYHHRRHRRHRSSNPPVESYSDHSISRKRESEHSVDSSHGHPSRRHRTAEEQAAHERRKAERQSRESYDVESRSKPREAPRSDRQSYHSSTRSSRSHSEPHPPPVNTEAPVVTPTKTSFDTKGHMVIEPNHAPRPKTRDTKDAPRPTSRDMRDVPRPVSRDTRNAPVRDYSRTEPSRHSVQVPRPRRNSMDVRSTADARNSVDLSRSKSHRRYREEEDGSRRHRKDEPRADPSSTAAPPSVPRATPELRDEPRHTTRREERQRVREAESQRKPSSTGFRASLKKLFT